MALTLSKKAQGVKPSSTLSITAKAKALLDKGEDIVGFVAGEPDFNTPNNINEAAIKAIHEGFTRYTVASGTMELKKAVCKKVKEYNHIEYTPEQVVISNGGKHSLTNIFQAIINPQDEIIIPSPYWLSYPEMIKLADGVPVFLASTKESKYKISPQQLQEAITPKTKAVILNTPSNPTGMIYTRDELKALANVIVKNNIYVISDEIYENLVYGGAEHVSIASLGEEIYKQTITCSGMSKSYAMTGWRIGYTCSSKEISKLMASIQSHQTSNPNSIAQKAAVQALNGSQSTVKEMCMEFDSRRQYIYSRICEMNWLSALEPQGAFYLFVDCSGVIGKCYGGKEIDSAARIAEILIEDYNVAVIPCADFGFPDYIRLSYAIARAQIEKGMERIEQFTKSLK